MVVENVAIYILPSLALSPAETKTLLATMTEEYPFAEEVTHNGRVQTTSDAIEYTLSTLEKDHWDHDYIIIVDRPGWRPTENEGVLVAKMDFKGEVDGLRMPTQTALMNIPSMSIGNTDWEDYIARARSNYRWDREAHFAVYVDSSIDDVDDALGFALPLIDDGLRGRKAHLGSICCAVDYERPSDVEEVGGYHGAVAEKFGCNERIGYFMEMKNWSMHDPRVRAFRLDENGNVDSFLVEVEMAGEVMGSVAMGLRGWEEEKSKYVE